MLDLEKKNLELEAEKTKLMKITNECSKSDENIKGKANQIELKLEERLKDYVSGEIYTTRKGSGQI